MKMDHRITAYAVGELQGREREVFETELSLSSSLQDDVDTMTALAEKFAASPKSAVRFHPDEHARLLGQCIANVKSPTRSKTTMLSTVLALAAVLVAFAGLAAITQQSGPFKWRNLTPLQWNSAASPFSAGGGVVGELVPPQKKPAAISSSDAMQQAATVEVNAIAQNNPATTAPRNNAAFAARMPAEQQMYAQSGAQRIVRPSQFSSAEERMAIQNEQMAVAQSLPPHQSPPAKIPVRSKVSSPFSSSLALPSEAYQNESYAPIREIEFVTASETPLSTFSIDVDTASYSNVRRFLEEERTPPADAIRTEELINYFRYNYPQPSGENAFSVNLEINRAPWNPEHELVRVGLKGREPSAEGRGPANLVFLVDVSGSMNSPDKLPLLQRSLSALVENLSDDDRVAIVTYAGSSGLVLDSTQGRQKREILDAIANLRSGGSTNGSGGIKQAYETARQNFLKDGNNRVILCTDGDFNVGVTDQGGLQKLIETERESGVFLSVLGFGRGNLKDSTMETLADKGNGNYAYIDSISEGRKVLVEQMGSTLFTIAKDVKIQVEFNPARVAGYRLIGYENRQLAKEDFNNDKIDAGEIGAGHTVTALYEIIPAGQKVQGSPTVDPLKYQQPEKKTVTASNEILTVKVRYKAPDGEKSSLLEIPLAAVEIPSPDKASEDFRFATAVAAFGMKLRGSPHVGEMTWAEIQDIARGALGKDPGSYRAEFLTLIEKAKALEKEEK